MVNLYHINNTLLILLVILVIFCILYLFYNGQDFSKLIYYNSSIDDKQLIMEIMTIAKNNAIQQIKEIQLNTLKNNKSINNQSINNQVKNKERFDNQQSQLLQNNAIKYNYSLNNIYEWVKSINEPNGMLNQIKQNLLIASKLRQEEKEKIIQNITNIYILEFLEQINKTNAVSYKVYDKYKNPTENKYYKQYTR